MGLIYLTNDEVIDACKCLDKDSSLLNKILHQYQEQAVIRHEKERKDTEEFIAKIAEEEVHMLSTISNEQILSEITENINGK